MKLKAFAVMTALLCLPGLGHAEEMPIIVDIPLEKPAEDPADALRRAQQYLIDLGRLEGRADGILGPRTASALRTFQAQNGLEETGELDAVTMDALEGAAEEAASVRDVQQRLIELGYLRGKADGIFGSRSVAALTLFQRVHDLQATGAIDARTTDRLFSDDVITLPKGLSGGDKGDDVAALQRRLIQFGFLSGSADGDYGPKTAAAVKRFQRHLDAQGIAGKYDIEADGEATPITRLLLEDASYSSYIRDLSPGDTGDEALRVETRLTLLGYMDLPADDTLDDYGLSALELFAEQAGIPFGGIADRSVIDGLFSADAPVADHCAPHDISSGDSGLAVRAAEDALVRGGMMIKLPNGRYNSAVEDAIDNLHAYLEGRGDARAALYSDSGFLSIEAQQALQDGLLGPSTGEGEMETARLQRRLHTLFFLARDGIDGKFGENTAQALRDFQSVNGLSESGEANADTQAVLYSAEAQAKPLPYRVEVSLSRQRVEIYQRNDAGEYEQVKRFTCSTGLGGSTPRGIFLDGFPVNRWHYFQKYDCWAQYSYEIEGNIMFHSVIYSSNDESTLRTGSVYALGSPASHGCIRLKVADAKWLFEHCSRGSLVIIIY